MAMTISGPPWEVSIPAPATGGSPHLGSVANEAAMLALSSAVAGSTCTRTDTGTVWILKDEPYSTASNWQDTGSGETLPQYAISGATSITRADHCNRVGVNATANPYTLTIQSDALGGYTGNEIVYGFQGSTGTVTIAASGATLRTPTGGKTVTTSQGDFVSAQRIGVDTWAITSISASGGGGASNYVAYALAAPVDYTLTATTTDVPGVGLLIPANTWKTGGLLRATVLTRHTGGTTAYNVRVRFGSTSIRAGLGVNAGNNNVYFSHAEVYNLGGGAQMSIQSTGVAAAEVTNGTPSTYTFTTTGDLTLNVALDGNAGDTVKIVGFTVEIINPA